MWETLQDRMSPELMAELDKQHLYNTNIYNGEQPISREQDTERRIVRHDITTATTLNVIVAHLHTQALEKRNKSHPDEGHNKQFTSTTTPKPATGQRQRP